MRVAFIGDPSEIGRVFGRGRRDTIERHHDAVSGVVADVDSRLAELSDVEAIFSTWGMPLLTEAQLNGMPKLRAVFYAAGAVDYFAEPLLARGILVSSAWKVNAIPVGEFAAAQIMLSLKGYFRNLREPSFCGPGAFGETVSLIGMGAVGSEVLRNLPSISLDICVCDPRLADELAGQRRLRKVTLQAAFREGVVVSCHLPDTEKTEGLIDGPLLSSMREGATFINTGRGRTVNQDEMVEVFRHRPDLTALLDVTHPEPLPPDHPLGSLSNVIISSHIAGSIGHEVWRMADSAIGEFELFLRGQKLRYGMPPAG